MEIERKYKIECLNDLPENYRAFPCHAIEQAYLCTDPVVRVRREDDSYYLTYKGKGLLQGRNSTFLPTKESYEHLLKKPTAWSSQKCAGSFPWKEEPI